MDSRIWKLSLCCLGLCLHACQLFEPRGFIVSYETADQRFEQSMNWNDQHPLATLTSTESEYDLYAISDIHVGGTTNLDLFLDQALLRQPMAVFMAGDLTTGHTEDYQRFYAALPSQDSLNLFPVPGNHDLYFEGWKQYQQLFGSSVYSFSIKTPEASDLYICLDNSGGSLGAKQLEWLKQLLLNERSLYRYCILVNHNNWIRLRKMVATNPYVEELEVLLDLCLRHQVDMVISGHDHQRHTAVFGNIRFLTLDALSDSHPSPSYLVLNVSPDSIAYSFRDL
ncbi:MAG: metallophosphoesterase [Bacteroidales bacterium]|jgi:predicted phosphodiesterase|nr:metallophosphoesterase [Bacteroidales bacterium]NLB02185.1 metallophosphoesterase [Bacteroidales bacterium]